MLNMNIRILKISFKPTSFPSGCWHRFAEHTDQSSSESSEEPGSEFDPDLLYIFFILSLIVRDFFSGGALTLYLSLPSEFSFMKHLFGFFSSFPLCFRTSGITSWSKTKAPHLIKCPAAQKRDLASPTSQLTLSLLCGGLLCAGCRFWAIWYWWSCSLLCTKLGDWPRSLSRPWYRWFSSGRVTCSSKPSTKSSSISGLSAETHTNTHLKLTLHKMWHPLVLRWTIFWCIYDAVVDKINFYTFQSINNLKP